VRLRGERNILDETTVFLCMSQIPRDSTATAVAKLQTRPYGRRQVGRVTPCAPIFGLQPAGRGLPALPIRPGHRAAWLQSRVTQIQKRFFRCVCLARHVRLRL
jgi:hypothetical protein